jgi:hypothetical protein
MDFNVLIGPILLFISGTLMKLLNYLIEFTLIFIQLTFKIRMHTFTNENRNELQLIRNSIQRNCLNSYFLNNEPCGLILGKWFMAYINIIDNGYGGTNKIINLLCRDETLKQLKSPLDSQNTSGSSETKEKSEDGYEYLFITGPPQWPHWNKQRRTMKDDIKPNPQQQKIIEAILEFGKKNQSAVVLLHGPPGTGKSKTVQFLANQIHALYTDIFRPTEPGDLLDYLILSAEPTSEKPLIIVIEEVDRILQKILIGPPTLTAPATARTEVMNLSDWNRSE